MRSFSAWYASTRGRVDEELGRGHHDDAAVRQLVGVVDELAQQLVGVEQGGLRVVEAGRSSGLRAPSEAEPADVELDEQAGASLTASQWDSEKSSWRALWRPMRRKIMRALEHRDLAQLAVQPVEHGGVLGLGDLAGAQLGLAQPQHGDAELLHHRVVAVDERAGAGG